MTVPIQMSQEMVDAVKKAGGNVKFTIFPEDSHDSWTDAYASRSCTTGCSSSTGKRARQCLWRSYGLVRSPGARCH